MNTALQTKYQKLLTKYNVDPNELDFNTYEYVDCNICQSVLVQKKKNTRIKQSDYCNQCEKLQGGLSRYSNQGHPITEAEKQRLVKEKSTRFGGEKGFWSHKK